MSTYDKIAWLPLCGGLTGLGLVLSFIVMRRRGLARACARRRGRCCRWPRT